MLEHCYAVNYWRYWYFVEDLSCRLQSIVDVLQVELENCIFTIKKKKVPYV